MYSTLYAVNIYVDNRTGNDAWNGTQKQAESNEAGPVRTLRRAAELAGPGDRIILAASDQPYCEPLTLAGLKHSGSKDYPLVVEGNGAILDGLLPLPNDVWEHAANGVFRFHIPLTGTELSFFRMIAPDHSLRYVVASGDENNFPPLAPNEWTRIGDLVYFVPEPGKNPASSKDYRFVYTAFRTGITLLNVRHIRIHDLTIQGFQVDGIAAFNNAREVVLDNVVCRQNGRAGLSIGGASQIAAGYCTFHENGNDSIHSQPYSQAIFYACEFDTPPDPEQCAGQVRLHQEE